MVQSITRTVEERRKTLAALTRQIKEMSFWRSTKGAVLALFDKPANKQSAELMTAVNETREENTTLISKSEEQANTISEMERTIARLRDEKSDMLSRLGALETSLNTTEKTNESMVNEIRSLRSRILRDQNTMDSWERDFMQIAENLIDHSTPDQIREYETRGIHKSIGENIWEKARETSKERIEKKRQEQSQSHARSRGMRL